LWRIGPEGVEKVSVFGGRLLFVALINVSEKVILDLMFFQKLGDL